MQCHWTASVTASKLLGIYFQYHDMESIKSYEIGISAEEKLLIWCHRILSLKMYCKTFYFGIPYTWWIEGASVLATF